MISAIERLLRHYSLLKQVIGITMAVILTWAVLEATWLIYYPAISIIAVFGVFTLTSAYALMSASRMQRKRDALIKEKESSKQ